MTTTTQENVFQKQENLIWRNVDNEVLLLDTVSGHYFSLNDSASKIWNFLAEGNSLEQAAQRLSETYDISVEAARADIDELLILLKEEHILS